MKTLSAKDAKYRFGRLIDLARAEPVVIAKHGRPVVVVMAIEEYERLAGKAMTSVRSDNTRDSASSGVRGTKERHDE